MYREPRAQPLPSFPSSWYLSCQEMGDTTNDLGNTELPLRIYLPSLTLSHSSNFRNNNLGYDFFSGQRVGRVD
jgi:hypothetical protein